MTFTQPRHAGELLQLADAHADDTRTCADRAAIGPRRRRPSRSPNESSMPTTASVPARVAPDEFQTHPASADADARRPPQRPASASGLSAQLRVGARRHTRADRVDDPIVSRRRAPLPAWRRRDLQSAGCRGGARPFSAQPLELVLDGQQRLTSLYQALFGVGASRFFLDVGALISGAEVNDAVRVFSAERAASLESLEAQANALMMPLAAVRGSGASDWRDEVVELRGRRRPSNVCGRSCKDVEQTFIKPLVRLRVPGHSPPAVDRARSRLHDLRDAQPHWQAADAVRTHQRSRLRRRPQPSRPLGRRARVASDPRRLRRRAVLRAAGDRAAARGLVPAPVRAQP